MTKPVCLVPVDEIAQLCVEREFGETVCDVVDYDKPCIVVKDIAMVDLSKIIAAYKMRISDTGKIQSLRYCGYKSRAVWTDKDGFERPPMVQAILHLLVRAKIILLLVSLAINVLCLF